MFKVSPQLWKYMRDVRRAVLNGVGVLAIVGLLLALPASGATAAPMPPSSGCQLGSPKGGIKHVIYIQFDNTHFRRDNPNVPSDLEQMPHLLNFITNNGVLMANDHTALISHTATGILTSLTGVLSRPNGPACVKLLPLLHTDRDDPHWRLVRVLDGATLRPGRAAIPARGTDGSDTGDDQREREGRPRTVGSLHPCRV